MAWVVTMAYRIEVGMLHLTFLSRLPWERRRKWGQYTSTQQKLLGLLLYARRSAKFLAHQEGWEIASLPSWSIYFWISEAEMKYVWFDIIIITLSIPRHTSKFPFQFVTVPLFFLIFKNTRNPPSSTDDSGSPDVVEFSWWISCVWWGLGLAESELSSLFCILEEEKRSNSIKTGNQKGKRPAQPR